MAKRIKEEFDTEFEDEDLEGAPEGGEFEGEPGEEEFEDEGFDDEEFEDEDMSDLDDEECEGISAGEIEIEGKRYCITLTPIEDDEEAEEDAEGESAEEEAEEGEEGEAEEEVAEHKGGENPFAARDDDLEEEELNEAIRLGMSDDEILQLYGEARRPRAVAATEAQKAKKDDKEKKDNDAKKDAK